MLSAVIKYAPTQELAERALAETSSISIEAAISWLKSNAESDNVLKPHVEKNIVSHVGEPFSFTSVSMQGWRSYMEDVVSINVQVDQFFRLYSWEPTYNSYFLDPFATKAWLFCSLRWTWWGCHCEGMCRATLACCSRPSLFPRGSMVPSNHMSWSMCTICFLSCAPL